MGAECIRRFLGQINTDELRGTIVAVPVANAYAHQALSRTTPLDGMNLNRIFPGSPDGSVTEQLADALTGILRQDVTHFVDYHSGGNLALVDYSYLHEPGAEMARAFGRSVLYDGPIIEGTSSHYALSQGIPTMVSELGGGSQRIEDYLGYGVCGTFNMLRAIGMLDGEVAPPPADQVVVRNLSVLRPSVGGVLLSKADASCVGARVPKGTVLGTIVDASTFEELEVLTAPYDPTILVLVRAAVTRNGAWPGSTPATARRASSRAGSRPLTGTIVVHDQSNLIAEITMQTTAPGASGLRTNDGQDRKPT
jgi:uncharacterized protein